MEPRLFGCVWKLRKNSTQNGITATKNFLSHNTENKIKQKYRSLPQKLPPALYFENGKIINRKRLEQYTLYCMQSLTHSVVKKEKL